MKEITFILSESEEREWDWKIFKETMAENKFSKNHKHIDSRIWENPIRMKPNKSMPRHIRSKLLKSKDKKNILKAAWEK